MAYALAILVSATIPLSATADTSATLSIALPSARAVASAVWDGSNAWLFGGYMWPETPTHTHEVVRFTPGVSASIVSPSLPTARSFTSAVWDGTNAWIAGGNDLSPSGNVNEIVRYTPSTGSVQAFPNAFPTGPRYATSAIYDGTNVYIFGGLCSGCNPAYHNEIVRYQPGQSSGVVLPSVLPHRSGYHAAVWDGSNAYVIGGYGNGAFQDTIVQFNPATGQVQTMGARLPVPLAEMAAVWDGSRVLIFGGTPATIDPKQDKVYAYTPATDSIDELAGRLPEGRASMSAVWDAASHYVYLFGGHANGNAKVATIFRFGPSPSAPTNLVAIRTAPRQLDLSWQPATGPGITGYEIHRGTQSGGETLLTTVAQTSFVDTGLTAGQTYFYVVKATNANGAGKPSNEASALAADVPSAPGNFSASLLVPNEIRLTWQTPSSSGGLPVTSYRIYCGAATGALSLCDTLGPATQWTHTGLANGALRFYRVGAVNAMGETSTTELSQRAADLPGAPPNFAAQRGPGVGQIRLTWQAAPSGGLPVTSHTVYRGDSITGPFSPAATVGNVLMWTDAGLANSASRCYFVTATNAVGDGTTTPTACAQAPDVPTVPTNLDARPGDLPSQVALAWTAPTTENGMAITGYAVHRTTVDNGADVRFTIPGAVTTFTDTQRIPGVRYHYRVAAINGVGEGPMSGWASGRASLLPPSLSTPLGELGDPDGDFAPGLVEQRICGTLLIETLMNSPVYGATGPIIGVCSGQTEWDPLVFYDADDDMVLDAAESTLCLIEDRNTTADGICVGLDYGLPPG